MLLWMEEEVDALGREELDKSKEGGEGLKKKMTIGEGSEDSVVKRPRIYDKERLGEEEEDEDMMRMLTKEEGRTKGQRPMARDNEQVIQGLRGQLARISEVGSRSNNELTMQMDEALVSHLLSNEYPTN